MKASVKAYNGLDQFSKIHRILIRIFLVYLFLIPGVSMFMHDQYLIHPPGWTLAVFLLINVIHLGFVVNNLHVPPTPLRTFLLIIRLPAELVFMTIWQKWEPALMLSSLYAFEVIGFATGLTIGTLFRKAAITLKHRIASFIIAGTFAFFSIMRFPGIFEGILTGADSIYLAYAVIGITVLTATIPYAQMFIGGEDDNGLNLGTSNLTSRLNKYLGLAMLINLVMMILGINL